MSGNSRDSGSLQKGFFKRMLGQDQSNAAKQSNVKQRHPSFTVSKDAAVTPGRSAKPQETIVSPGVKKLNKDGYVVYNTPEKEDVYISIHPETAFFEDDEPEMVRMAGGSFVGAKKSGSSVEIPIKAEYTPEPIVYSQPADLFANAYRKDEFDEIDFNEIIIKKNDSFDEEIENAPLFAPQTEVFPQFVERSVPVMESQMAMTSSAKEVEVADPHVTYMGYREVSDYVEEVVEEEVFIETPSEPIVEEVPIVEDIVTFRGATFSEVPITDATEEPVEEMFVEEDTIVEMVMEEEITEQSAEVFEMTLVADDDLEEIIMVEDAQVEMEIPEETMFVEEIAERNTFTEVPILDATAEDEPILEMAVKETHNDVEDFVTPTMDTFEMPEEVQVTEAPIGLYVERHEPIDAASMDGDATALSSFMEDSLEAETAVTAEAAPIQENLIGKMVDENDYLCLPAPREPIPEMTQEEIVVESTSETIVEQPLVHEVKDLVADIMKLTIPGLHMSEDMIAELSEDWELSIPDDDLESYDEKFVIREVAKPAVTETCGVSFNFEGKESAYNQNPTVNFRF